jgi:hypothetical protein
MMGTAAIAWNRQQIINGVGAAIPVQDSVLQ